METADDDTRVRVSCCDCSFERVVPTDGDIRPADTLIERGQRTGHTPTVSRVEE